MGISVSQLPLARRKVLNLISKIFVDAEADDSLENFLSRKQKKVLNSISFQKRESEELLSPKSSGKMILEHSLSFKSWEPDRNKLQILVSFEGQNLDVEQPNPISFSPEGRLFPVPEAANCSPDLISSGVTNEQNAAALKIQKVYRGHRVRRSLADCAVVIEELWWKALDFASLKRSSVSFFDVKKPETAVSRWARARTRAAKVGKGLSKDDKAQKLALQHWLEAIDPRHRYGHNLHLYYDVWFSSESTQPFFYWLDIGDGKEFNLEKCSRSRLQSQCIRYLGPKEREAYEVIIVGGKLLHKKTPLLLNTVEGTKWIFVLSTTRNLYVGQKRKGEFQHSSFLAGGAITAAGRLVAKNGVLQAIWPYSGHYLPTEENFKEFISFLEEHNVDLSNVKRYAVDDDEYPSFRKVNEKPHIDVAEATDSTVAQKGSKMANFSGIGRGDSARVSSLEDMDGNIADRLESHPFDFGNRLSCKWSSGVGPRISCVRDYPTDLQFKALEQVNLSPRPIASPTANKTPIPSPRPTPGVMLSPRLAYIGLPSPRLSLTLPPLKKT